MSRFHIRLWIMWSVCFVVGGSAWAAQEPSEKEKSSEETDSSPQEEAAQESDPLDDMYFDERVIFEKVPEVVTPTRTKRTIRRAPGAVTVLRGDQVMRLGWPTLSDAMRTIPGAEVMRTFSTESNVAFRGFNGPSGTSSGVLLLVDGRQTYLDMTGENNWDNLPVALEDIERVEIIRGPGSFLYGPNALHGVVNVITKRPSETMAEGENSSNRVSTTLGSYDTVISSVQGAWAGEGWGLRATAGWNDVDPLSDIATPEYSGERSKEMGFGNILYRRDYGEEHGWELEAGYQSGNYSTVRTGNLYAEIERSYGKFNYWVDGLNIQLIADYFDGDVYNLVIPLVPAGSRGENLTGNLDVHYTTDWEFSGTHTTIFGAGFIYTRAGSDELTAGMESQVRPAGYVQDEWGFSEDLYLTYGLRIDHHPESGVNWSPQAALLYLYDDNHSLRVSVKRGFRDPSYIESFVDITSGPIPILGGATVDFEPSEDLKAERILSFEAGYSGLFLEQIKVGLDFFFNRVDDIIEIIWVGGNPLIRQFQNSVDAEVYGAEFSTDVLLTDNVSLWGNVSFQRTEDRATGESLPQAPETKGNLGLRVSFPSDGLYADLWVNYFGEMGFEPLGEAPIDFDSRWMVNARVAWSFWEGRGEVWASVVNINDEEHQEHFDGEEFGRAFYVGFQVR